MADNKDELARQAASLAEAWDERAASDLGRFFIASHAGFEDAETWQARARFDAATLCLGLTPAQLSGMRVLEIGCGVGRLAKIMAPMVKSYTGVDLSAVYLEQARESCGGLEGVRFLQSTGDALPVELAGESFDFIFSWAVFIHCPKQIIEALVRGVPGVLAADGIFRANVLSEVGCEAGRTAPLPPSVRGMPELDVALAQIHRDFGARGKADLQESELANAEQILAESGLQHLTTERPYMGSRFSHKELQASLDEWMPKHEAVAFRIDSLFLWILVG